MNGVLVLDKPPGPTCQKILSEFRRAYPKVKVGYTGTLDPFATGVLPVFIGEGTKLIPYVEEETKEYEALLRLGKSTDTLDRMGEIEEEATVPPLSFEKVSQILKSFLGERLQTPPRYSAVKIAGTPLYRYARKGIEVEAKPRLIEIFSIELLELGSDFIRFHTHVRRGTYIRCLGEDLALALGTVGHLGELRRLGSGPFALEESLQDSDWLKALQDPEFLKERLLFHSRRLLQGFRHLVFKHSAQAERHRQGQAITLTAEDVIFSGPPLKKGEKVLTALDREFLSVSECVRWGNAQDALLKPLRILKMPLGESFKTPF